MIEPLRTPPFKREALAKILRAHPGNSTKQQCARIRAALSHFSVTTYECSRYLDCYDPRARVTTLRRNGEPIKTHWTTIETESGERHRVGLYVLVPGGNRA